MKNKKGFTLVELLAVIVVLAIIMIIAVPSVMESMNSARSKAFIIYSQKVLNTSSIKYQSKILMGENIATCYYLDALMGAGTGNYEGYVEISNPNTDTTDFTITLKDNNYSVEGKNYAALGTPAATKSLTYPNNCCKTMACGDSDKHGNGESF